MKIVETFWSKPVSVRLQNGLDHSFPSVEDTLDFLENEWPNRTGRHYRRATDLCRGALNRNTPPEVAREAVIAACVEAGLPLVPFGRVGPRRSGSIRAAW